MSLAFLSIAEAGRRLRAGEVRSAELIDAAIRQVDTHESKLNAFITPMLDEARAAAARADADFAAGIDRGPLQGIPVGLKDLCATRGVRTTAGSKVLAEWVPDEDATVVQRLKHGGAVIMGKLNMHEFAYGVTSANAHYGPVGNPWDPDRHPGGSSGGSAAAVGAGMCAGAIGTDTGGSIRIPAAVCGLTGLMPTYGVVSRRGVVPLSWSLDHVGPLARSVEDAALFVNAIAGYDQEDPGSAKVDGFDATSKLGRPVAGMRVGVVRSQFTGIAAGVQLAVETALETLRGIGCDVEEVDLPGIEAMRWLPVLSVEAAAIHQEWLQERPEDYSDDVRARILYGFASTGTEYVNALRLRREFTEQVAEAMRDFDVLAMPTCPEVACRIDEIADGALQYARLTAPWDHTGQPVLSVPCGIGEHGMPVGLSLAGRPFDEATLCQVGNAYQQATGWHRQIPPAIAGG
ncbi:MAG: amidase [Dehalococcoidia bacterium]|nr:amidase [Dehalococcoidia bacterium]